jgi:anti-sigma-K factor RskA
MDCKEAEELLVPYVLGAIDDRERRLVDSHLESCGACSVALYGETVAGFAFELPQLEAPPQVKQRLFRRVERDGRLARMASRFMVKIGIFAHGFSQAFMPHVGKAVASVLIIGVVFAGVWFNDRLNYVAETNHDLANQLEASQQREAEAREAVNTTINALANPRMSVNFLKGTGAWTSARGVMVSQTETRALLLVVDLPPLPADKVYQVWLIKDRKKYNAGWFTVDSTGYGQTVIIPVAPFWEFEAAGITIEPAGGSIDPTGVNVLKGEL